jgi:hypothetical protein
MAMVERIEKLRGARDGLMPVLTLLDDCEEHHLAAIISSALDTLEIRIANRQPPAGSNGS